MISRALLLDKLICQNYSIFLFGPRGVGKTSLLNQLPNIHLRYDLLLSDTLRSLTLDAALLRRQVENALGRHDKLLVAIDEIQSLPTLLNEVHFLIEKYRDRLNFILTGSSARKLKRQDANMLGGRAVQTFLHPLSLVELKLDLYRALQFGTLPRPYLEAADPAPFLTTYVDTYLREEIKQESLVRKIDAFIRFLDLAAQMQGANINFSKLGRSCGVAGSTIEQYYSVLEDTLLVQRLDGWGDSVKRQLVTGPRYYFFDCGMLNALKRELSLSLERSSYRYGKLFESFIVNEARKISDYFNLHCRFYYWRTNSGLEVDLIIARSQFEPPLAIEIKSGQSPEAAELRGLKAFKEDNPSAVLKCVCETEHPYQTNDIEFIPWNNLDQLMLAHLKSEK